MSENVFFTPSSTDPFTELSRTKSGTIYEKQILPLGRSFVDPRNPTRVITPSKEMFQKMVDNFHAGYGDIVQFPVVNDKNQHVENPLSNLGEVIGLKVKDTGLYAQIDVRKNTEDVGKTILGASAMYSDDYVDTATGKRVGPTLLHVAATNRPYITNLEPFTEIIESSTKLSVDNSIEDGLELISLSNAVIEQPVEVVPVEVPEPADKEQVVEPAPKNEKEPEGTPMTKEELLAQLKSEHGVDVEALQAKADTADEATAQLSKLEDEKAVALSAVAEGDEKYATLGEAVVELSNTVNEQKSLLVELSARETALRTERAEKVVDEYIREGRALAKSREYLIKLSLDGDNDALEALVAPKGHGFIDLSQRGVEVVEDPAGSVADDVDRYTKAGNENLRRTRSVSAAR